MNISHRTCVALLVAFLVSGNAWAAFQDEKKQNEPTEASIQELQEAIDGLQTGLKEKDNDHTQAMIDKVAGAYKGGDKATCDKAVEALKKCLKHKEKSIVTGAISALGRTGGKAVKILLKGAKSAKKDAALQQRYLTAAGKLRDDKSVGDLLKYLNHKDNNTVKASIYALGFYNESSTKIRKDIVKSLLKRYASVASAYRKPNPATSDKQRYEALYNPFESVLKKLTKQELQGYDAWNKWYRNDGKKRKEW